MPPKGFVDANSRLRQVQCRIDWETFAWLQARADGLGQDIGSTLRMIIVVARRAWPNESSRAIERVAEDAFAKALVDQAIMPVYGPLPAALALDIRKAHLRGLAEAVDAYQEEREKAGGDASRMPCIKAHSSLKRLPPSSEGQ